MADDEIYVELHTRSAFSFLRGASQPEALVRRAAAMGYTRAALCDRGGFYGSARFHFAGREAGLGHPIVGAEVPMDDGSVLPVLVRTRTGYRNLCRLFTDAHLRAEKGQSRVGWEELAAAAEGLQCLSGDEDGPVRRLLDSGADKSEITGAVDRLMRVFGPDNVTIELQRHGVRGEEAINRRLVDLARATRLPIVATGGVCFCEKHDRVLYDALTCLYHYTTLDEAGSLLSRNSDRHLKSPARMRALFADLPEAIENTRRVADRCEFSLEKLGYEFPAYPTTGGETMADTLRRETYAGARGRYGRITPKIRKQLEHELAIIEKLGFCGYFLIVWEIMNKAREMGVLAQGRGSAANSAVCYSLGITVCDPIGGKLLFERFLAEGRKSWPDIDIDLPSGDRRESVIQWVYERYVPRGAAMTANVITYRGRSAVREMGKVLGLSDDFLSRFADLYHSGDFPHTLEMQDQVEKAGLPADHPRLLPLVDLYKRIYGLPRHLGQHSGGMVVSDKPLDRVVPLENASMPGRVVLQWDKDDCDDLGIVKVDLLGLGMMACIQDTVELCQKRGRGREFELHKIPKDDVATFEMMQRADTVGVFQVESRAQMATLPRMKPKVFYDVVIEVALIRPGPIVGDLVHPYLNRRDGKEPIDYIDPRFKPVLERTLGVPLFQEQVLKMAMIVADFTGSEAEELRKAMSFHRSEERMQKVMDKLRKAMQERDVAEKAQEKIIKSICSFALYGFPESHAISFGTLAYASVWMKAHRGVEFFASLLNNQPMGFYAPDTLIKDAQRHGIRVRPVSVIDSDVLCTVESDHALRLGLNQVKSLGAESAERLVAAREESMWESLEDLLLRTGIDKRERRMLARIGAFNGLPQATHRREALWNVEMHTDEDDLFTHARVRGPRGIGFQPVSERGQPPLSTKELPPSEEPPEPAQPRTMNPNPEQSDTSPASGHGQRRGTGFQPVSERGQPFLSTGNLSPSEEPPEPAQPRTMNPNPEQSDTHSESGHRLEACATASGRTTHKSKRNLPHWTRDGATYAVTFRLFDSIPIPVTREYEQEKKRLQFHFDKALEENDHELAHRFRQQQRDLYHQKIESQLDAGHGQCWLRKHSIAQIVANALQHFDGDRYTLHAWCIMPNHVHTLVTPEGDWPLSKITHSWKSYTANEANRALKRNGTFWQDEPYDHLVRDEEDFLHQREYILQNPSKAGLKNWNWVCDSGTGGPRGTGFQPVPERGPTSHTAGPSTPSEKTRNENPPSRSNPGQSDPSSESGHRLEACATMPASATALPPAIQAMTPPERLASDYEGLGLTTGPHPMAYIREQIRHEVWRAIDLEKGEHGQVITIGGMVICRQRPGTAKGHLFISLEDETGISNAFVPAPTFEAFRLVITQEPFLKLRGHLQKVDNVISLYTHSAEALKFHAGVETASHDFH